MTNIQTIIFDLDGTLIDTLRDLADSANHALNLLGLPPHPVDSFRYKVGDGARKLVSRCLDDQHRHLIDTMLQQQRAYYTDHCCDHTKPYPGIPDMLAAVKNLNLKLAVLSNKPHDFTKQIVAHYFGPDLFDIVRGQLPNGPLKPDPASALQIAQQLNTHPNNCAFLGDTAIDMKTANHAAMFPIGATWGFRDRNELQTSGAQKIIDHPSNLIEALTEIQN